MATNKINKDLHSSRSFNSTPYLFIFSFIIWIYCFRKYLLGEFILESDAKIYFEHIKYFIDQISRGVYPLWDPTRQNGVPNEFFLRRIGSFNPIYGLIVVCLKLGLSFRDSYFTFITVYFFLGMTGFYQLCKIWMRDRDLAFLAYLLLSFSSIATILFKSFIILVFVPTVWFFAFLMNFKEEKTRYSFVGMILCLMLIFTTYLPFYFLTIFMVFLLCFGVLHCRSCLDLLRGYVHFIRNHLLFVCFWMLLLIISLIPGVLLFLEAQQGLFVMPLRHFPSPLSNSLTLPMQSAAVGGIPAVSVFSDYFRGLSQFQLGKIYMPVFIYILILLGVVTKLNKKQCLLFLIGVFIFLIGVYDASPIYQILYRRIFFFKYFRNFQFFIWIVLLPAFILLGVEHFSQYLKERKKRRLVGVVSVHIFLGAFLYYQEQILVSTYFVLSLSCLFFVLHELGAFVEKRNQMVVFLFVLIVGQSFEVFNYMNENGSVSKDYSYRYENPYLVFWRGEKQPESAPIHSQGKRQESYMTTRWNYKFQHTQSFQGYRNYVNKKFLVYESMGEEKLLETTTFSPKGEPLEFNEESPLIELIEFDVNQLNIKTSFPVDSILVYNDNFYPGWQAYVDGEKVPLYRVNTAFKGVFLPEGKRNVIFRFGKSWQYALNWFLIMSFIMTFLYLLYLGCWGNFRRLKGRI